MRYVEVTVQFCMFGRLTFANSTFSPSSAGRRKLCKSYGFSSKTTTCIRAPTATQCQKLKISPRIPQSPNRPSLNFERPSMVPARAPPLRESVRATLRPQSPGLRTLSNSPLSPDSRRPSLDVKRRSFDMSRTSSDSGRGRRSSTYPLRENVSPLAAKAPAEIHGSRSTAKDGVSVSGNGLICGHSVPRRYECLGQSNSQGQRLVPGSDRQQNKVGVRYIVGPHETSIRRHC